MTQIYIGQTSSRSMLEVIRQHGWRLMVVRSNVRQLTQVDRFAFDNGAFKDWKRGLSFDESKYLYDLDRINSWDQKPDFCVIPDIVAGGLKSLDFSMGWMERMPRDDWYLAVQDKMTSEDIPWDCGITGIFVGGSKLWKLRTLHYWTEEAHAHGLRCHVGRMGTPRLVNYAIAAGVDSLDSSFPLWTKDRMARFVQEVCHQGRLF